MSPMLYCNAAAGVAPARCRIRSFSTLNCSWQALGRKFIWKSETFDVRHHALPLSRYLRSTGYGGVPDRAAAVTVRRRASRPMIFPTLHQGQITLLEDIAETFFQSCSCACDLRRIFKGRAVVVSTAGRRAQAWPGKGGRQGEENGQRTNRMQRDRQAHMEPPRRCSSPVIACCAAVCALPSERNDRYIDSTTNINILRRLPSFLCLFWPPASNGCGHLPFNGHNNNLVTSCLPPPKTGGDDCYHGHLGAVVRAVPRLSALSSVRSSAPSGGAERALVVRAKQRVAVLGGRWGGGAHDREAGVLLYLRV